MRNTVLYQVHLGGELKAAVERIRAETGASASNVIRDLLREALEAKGLIGERQAVKA